MNLQKPTLVHVIAWTTLTSGIVNLFWGFAAAGTAIATIVGIFCAPFVFLPTILGVFELIYAAKLFSNPPQTVKPSTNIAVFEIACVLTGNLFAMAVGILSLVFYNDAVVKDYFTRLNSGSPEPAPSPATPPAPVTLPAPAVEEPVVPPAEESQTEEPPAKPKRAPRKVAKK
jgi:hypothetical protein